MTMMPTTKNAVLLICIVICISITAPLIAWGLEYRGKNTSPEFRLIRDLYGILNRPIDEKRIGTATDTEKNLIIDCIESHENDDDINEDFVVKLLIVNPSEFSMPNEWVVSIAAGLCAYNKGRNTVSSDIWCEAFINNMGLLNSRRPDLITGPNSLQGLDGIKRMIKLREDAINTIKNGNGKSG
jgi:hypothetical protein